MVLQFSPLRHRLSSFSLVSSHPSSLSFSFPKENEPMDVEENELMDLLRRTSDLLRRNMERSMDLLRRNMERSMDLLRRTIDLLRRTWDSLSSAFRPRSPCSKSMVPKPILDIIEDIYGMGSLLLEILGGHPKPINRIANYEFSVTTAPKGGIDIHIASHTIHAPKHASAHDPLLQMVLFARNLHKDKDTFGCPKSMVPKPILDIIEGSCWRTSSYEYKLGLISGKRQSESRSSGSYEATPMGSNGGGIISTATPWDNTAEEDDYYDAMGDGENHPQPHYESRPSNEKISKLSSEGTAVQLLEQDTLTRGDHRISDGSFPVRQGAGIDREEAMVLTAAAHAHDQNILNNPDGSRGTPLITSSAHKDADEFADTEPEHLSGPDSHVAGHCITKAEDKTAASWVLSCAAPQHATGDPNLLSELTPEHGHFVQAGDGTLLEVCGSGPVITDAIVLPKVWFVPGLTVNLVSAIQLLTELDYSVAFARGECYIRSATDGTVAGKAHVAEDGLFELDFLKVPLGRLQS